MSENHDNHDIEEMDESEEIEGETEVEKQLLESVDRTDMLVAILVEGFTKGFSQKEIAEKAHISPGYLSKIKKKALTGEYSNLLPLRDAILGVSDVPSTENDLVTRIKKACEPRKTKSTSTTEATKLTPAERKIVGVSAEELSAGEVFVLKREIKETVEDPSLSDLLKAYAILEKHKSESAAESGENPDGWSDKALIYSMQLSVHPDTPSVT